MSAIDDVGEVEDRQEHANDHAADDNSQEDNQHGFKERHEAGERGFNFFVEKVRDALEHVVNVAGLFAGAQHADDHAGENRVLAERGGNAFAPFNVEGGGLDGLFHDDVADGLRDNLQHFQDGHTAANERGERAREADQANFMRNVAGWSKNAVARLRSIANTLKPALQTLLGALKAVGFAIGVSFPW